MSFSSHPLEHNLDSTDDNYEYRCVRAKKIKHRGIFVEVNLHCSVSRRCCSSFLDRRHVILPKDLAKTLPKSRLLTESEWRGIGVQQSRGWQHYAIHRPEPHILLFRRVRLVKNVAGFLA